MSTDDKKKQSKEDQNSGDENGEVDDQIPFLIEIDVADESIPDKS